MKIVNKKMFWAGLLFFPAAALILFFPALHRSFACDDFSVLKRITLDHTLLVKGFFRPLSDLSLYFNYRIGGYNPAGYYIFNILVHGLSSTLLFFFCLKWKWTAEPALQKKFAVIAAILFLTYPFHSECIVWILGRASLMANMFGLAALLALVSATRKKNGILWACILYFIGLTSYESIILLPLMAFVVLYHPQKTWRQYVFPVCAFTVTLLIHLFIRIKVSGVFVGTYGHVFFSQLLLNYAGNIGRVGARLFLPPVQDIRMLMTGFSGVIFLGIAALIAFFKKHREDVSGKTYFKKLLLLLGLSVLLPFLLGVSTKTSESDRFLYFPSFFLCMGIAFLMVNLAVGRNSLLLWLSLFIASNIFFLEKNNLRWNSASVVTKDILHTIKVQDSLKKIVIVNLPDELDGAYIFRIGLQDALLLQGIDTTKLVVLNHLKREEMNRLPDSIMLEHREGFMFIPPFVTVRKGSPGSSLLSMHGNPDVLIADSQTIVLYWDKKSLKLLP